MNNAQIMNIRESQYQLRDNGPCRHRLKKPVIKCILRARNATHRWRRYIARVSAINAVNNKSVLYSRYHIATSVISGETGGIKTTKEISLLEIRIARPEPDGAI